jgi:hypothetical protein
LITGNVLTLLFIVLTGGGEKLIICGVKGAHLVEFIEAVSREDVEEFADGLHPSVSPSTINSVKHNILQPRLRARTPESLATVTSSEDAVEELGEVARVLATEPWLALPGSCPGAVANAANDCEPRGVNAGRGAEVDIHLFSPLQRWEASPTA